MKTIEEKLEEIKKINILKDKVEAEIETLTKSAQSNINIGQLPLTDAGEIRDLVLAKYKNLKDSLIKKAEAIINEN
jgi:hypothetical protein